eukprot:jgi/Mesvir1/12291/Mv00496-RA.2
MAPNFVRIFGRCLGDEVTEIDDSNRRQTNVNNETRIHSGETSETQTSDSMASVNRQKEWDHRGVPNHGVDDRVCRAQAEKLKETGNEYVAKGKLSAAIEAYTEAISLNPNQAVFWTNRAIVFRKQGNWERTLSDSRQALALDVSSVKAHYLIGMCLLHGEQPDLETSIRHLEKALDLARSKRRNQGATLASEVENDAYKALSDAKFSLWKDASAARQRKRQLLRTEVEAYFQGGGGGGPRGDGPAGKASNGERKSWTDVFRRSTRDGEAGMGGGGGGCGNGCGNGGGNGAARGIDLTRSPDDSRAGNAGGGDESVDLLAFFRLLLEEAETRDKPSEIPEHLCCKLTFELFVDPWIAPSGITYEHAAILRHLKEVGQYDPFTRDPLSASQLVRNLAVRDAVNHFLAEHPWAYKLQP